MSSSTYKAQLELAMPRTLEVSYSDHCCDQQHPQPRRPDNPHRSQQSVSGADSQLLEVSSEAEKQQGNRGRQS